MKNLIEKLVHLYPHWDIQLAYNPSCSPPWSFEILTFSEGAIIEEATTFACLEFAVKNRLINQGFCFEEHFV